MLNKEEVFERIQASFQEKEFAYESGRQHAPGCLVDLIGTKSEKRMGHFHTGLFRDKQYQFTTIGLKEPLDAVAMFSFEVEVRNELWGVKSGDVVIDIGASYGSYTLAALAAGAAQVIAIEPGNKELCTLSTSLVLNGWAGKCCLMNAVVADRDGPVGYYSQSHSLRVHLGETENRLAVTLDWLTSGMSRVDWIKIDVEGAELQVIEGGLAAIARLKPKILLEHHSDWVPDDEQKIREKLVPLGYKETRGMREVKNGRWILWEPKEA